MIPKPRGLKDYPFFKLRAIYHWSDDRFNALRKAVDSASKRYFDYGKLPSMKISAKWEKVSYQVATMFPELEEFEDHWPVYVFLRRQRENVKRMAKRMKFETTRPCNGQSPSDFVGKPLPRRMQFRVGKMGATTASRPSAAYHKKSVATHIQSVRPSFEPSIAQSGSSRRPTRVSQLHIDRDSEQMPAMGQRPTRTWLVNGSGELAIDAGCVACLFCNYIPNIPAGAQAHIQVFSRNKGISDALARLGITNDKHLSILNLLATWNAGPKEFLESMAEGILSPLYKFSLLQHFQKYYLSNSPVPPHQIINCWSGCPNHSYNNEKTPPKLQKLLEELGMEELAPLFSVAHVETEDEFDMLHDLDEPQRLAVFDEDQFRH
ncbi:hypothetical protein C0995_000777, partial [Termitomyces sp. Mi166